MKTFEEIYQLRESKVNWGDNSNRTYKDVKSIMNEDFNENTVRNAFLEDYLSYKDAYNILINEFNWSTSKATSFMNDAREVKNIL